MLRVDPEPFEFPFDRLTVLRNVEGLTAPREIEGGSSYPDLQRGLDSRRRVTGRLKPGSLSWIQGVHPGVDKQEAHFEFPVCQKPEPFGFLLHQVDQLAGLTAVSAEKVTRRPSGTTSSRVTRSFFRSNLTT